MPSSATAPEQARPRGRPSTGARERILRAAFEVLAADGYAGLTTQKVASESGENKALIHYHFGSKDGLVEAVARANSDHITAAMQAAGQGAETVEELVESTVEGMWKFVARRPELQRVHFDLSAQAIAHERIRAVVRETGDQIRALLIERFASVTGRDPSSPETEALATYLMASFDGLCLELVQRGDAPALKRARAILKRNAVDLLSR